MIIINTPLKADVFQKAAEEEGLVFIKKTGIRLEFDNPAGNDESMAVFLKKKCKGIRELSSIYFQVSVQ
ncbi:hypothetical protein AALB39_11110 [Lachnospiraceae bacterium 54-53]